MTRQLAQATPAHPFAATTAGADEVTASCEATLAHLGRVVEAVGFLHNRNLSVVYWERVEQAMPLSPVRFGVEYAEMTQAWMLGCVIRHERHTVRARLVLVWSFPRLQCPST